MKDKLIGAVVAFALGCGLAVMMLNGVDKQLEIEAAHAAGEMK